MTTRDNPFWQMFNITGQTGQTIESLSRRVEAKRNNFTFIWYKCNSNVFLTASSVTSAP